MCLLRPYVFVLSIALFGALSSLFLSLSGELLMSFSGIQSMSGRLLGSLTNLAPLPMSSALSSQSSAGSLSFRSLTFTLLGSPVSLFLILAVHLVGNATIL